MKQVPLSKTLLHFYSTHDLSSRQARIVIDENTINDDGLFLRQCTDFDCTNFDNNIPAEFINDWDLLIYCDYKVRPVDCLNIKTLLEKFTLNKQPSKILHISLDDSGVDAKSLLEKIPALEIHGELIVEINDKTETITELSEARSLRNLLKFKTGHVYYWNNSRYTSNGYGLELSFWNSHPEYY